MILLNDIKVIRNCASIALAAIARDLDLDYSDVIFHFEYVGGRLIPEISARNTHAWTQEQVRAVFSQRAKEFKEMAAERLRGNHQRRVTLAPEKATGYAAADAVIRAARASRAVDLARHALDQIERSEEAT